ncbi:hypothetical protein KR044_006320, partial [Drosophila immigrans]
VKTGNLYLAIIISNYCAFVFGTTVGWINPAENQVLRKNTYKFKPTRDQWDLICFFLPIGIVIWCLPMGALMKYHGCKSLMYVQVVPYICAWMLFLFANSIYMLYVGRFLQGMCGAAVCLAVPVYLNEICQRKYRGTVGSFFFGAFIYGNIYSQVMIEYVQLHNVHVVNAALALPFVFIWIIPESPYHYVSVHRTEKARSALIWLRGKQHDVDAELKSIALQVNHGIDVPLDGWESFKHSVKPRTVARSAAILIFYFLGGGLLAIMYMDVMLHDIAGSAYQSYLWGLLVCMALGHLLCVLLVDRIGRRLLLVLSTAISAVCSIFLCCWFRQSVVPTDHPFIKFTMYLFVMAFLMGLGPVAWLLNVELILPAFRPFGCAMSNLVSWLLVIVAMRWIRLRQSECMIFEGVIVILLLGLLFIMIFLPETNDLSPMEIQRIIDASRTTFDSDES